MQNSYYCVIRMLTITDKVVLKDSLLTTPSDPQRKSHARCNPILNSCCSQDYIISVKRNYSKFKLPCYMNAFTQEIKCFSYKKPLHGVGLKCMMQRKYCKDIIGTLSAWAITMKFKNKQDSQVNNKTVRHKATHLWNPGETLIIWLWDQEHQSSHSQSFSKYWFQSCTRP